MLAFYWLSFGVMVIASLYYYKSECSLFALNGIVLLSFASFFLLCYSGYDSNQYTMLDSIRIMLVMSLILHCGLLSKTPKLYLIYAAALLVNLIVNAGSMLIAGFAAYADSIYLIIALVEIGLFIAGIHKTIIVNANANARTRNDYTHTDNLNSGGNYFSWHGRGGEVIQKDETR